MTCRPSPSMVSPACAVAAGQRAAPSPISKPSQSRRGTLDLQDAS